MLARDVVMSGGGGGEGAGASGPDRGAERAARFLMGLVRLGKG
jgi:hypothetical protein